MLVDSKNLKNWFPMLLVLIGGFCIGCVFLSIRKAEQGDLQAKIKHLENQDARKTLLIDSAMVVIGKQSDSLRIAKNTIMIKDQELIALHKFSNLKINEHEKIVFIGFTSDSLRVRELSNLYPTLNH